MYNVRIKVYGSTQQIQVFSKAQFSTGESSSKRANEYTGEDITGTHFEEVPFLSDGAGRVKSFGHIRNDSDIERSRRRTINMIYDYSRSNPWEWFVTLTLNPLKVNRYDYAECSKKLARWLNNMRKLSPDMMYLVVPEEHKDGAWHFHGLFAHCDGMAFVDSGKQDCKGRVIWNVGKYRLGFSTATQISDLERASAYICKYISKDLCKATMGRKRYWISRNLSLPEVYEFYFESSFDDRVAFEKEGASFIKNIESPFGNVCYIEKPFNLFEKQ